jgi:hypothetical protein
MKDKDRWKGPEDLNLKALNLNRSPFGLKNGYEDFRGLTFPRGLKLINGKYENLDLSSAVFTNTWVEKNNFTKVIFYGTSFSEISDHGNKFLNCHFEKTDFRGAGLGYLGTNYSNCHFVQCNFSKAVFIRAVFFGCTFENCKMKNVDFNASSFQDCIFKGRYDDIWFRGDYKFPDGRSQFGEPLLNRMDRVSFEEAELHRLAFSQGCSLDSIIIPKNGSYTFVKKDWRRVLLGLEHQAALLPPALGKEIGIFTSVYLVGSDKQDQYLLNNKDIVDDFGKDAADIIIDALSV